MTLPKSAATKDALRKQAYEFLGVTPEAVAESPSIAYWIRKMEGGKVAALRYLRGSDLPEARSFVRKYDNPNLPEYCRSLLPIEAFAVAAGINPTRLYGVIAEAAHYFEARQGAIEAAAKHVDIVNANSERALAPKGGRGDRMMHLKHMGWLPSPKGSQINIAVNAQAKAESDVKTITAVSAPNPNSTIRRMVSRFQGDAPRELAPPREIEATPEPAPMSVNLLRSGDGETWEDEEEA